MLERDTVLLEMLREAAWRDYECRSDYSDCSSSELMFQGRQDKIFLDLIEYIDYLSETEDDILGIVKYQHKAQQYKDIFGKSPQCRVLLDGLRNSLNYSGIMQNSDVGIKFRRLENKVNSLMTAF